MRILVATDGSEAAAIGVAQARVVATRGGSELRILAVVPPASDLLGRAWTGVEPRRDSAAERAARAILEDRLRSELERTASDLRPSWAVVEGRPADAIIAEAERWQADVLVVGSRGHGTLESAVIGSVSEEVVDRARMPVLVSRRPDLERLVVAFDGSPAATAAVDLIATPTFRGLHAWIVDVAPSAYPWWLGLSAANPGGYQQLTEMSEEAREEEQATAEAAAATLREAGLVANSCHRIGDAADSLVHAAAELGADTIVIGSRGRTGIARIVLGSVTRQVLRHTDASVLVVHPVGAAEDVTPSTLVGASGRVGR